MKYKFLVLKGLRGQSILQYMAIMGIVTAAVVAMGPGLRRTMQAGYKNVADQIGAQDGFRPDPKKGYIDKAESQTSDYATTTRTEDNGVITLDRRKGSKDSTLTVSHYGNPPE